VTFVATRWWRWKPISPCVYSSGLRFRDRATGPGAWRLAEPAADKLPRLPLRTCCAGLPEQLPRGGVLLESWISSTNNVQVIQTSRVRALLCSLQII
jgi:hypothetical protein